MQLPLEAATHVQFHEASASGDPSAEHWKQSDNEGAKGFYEGLAHVYVTLADMAWSAEYWGQYQDTQEEEDFPHELLEVDNMPKMLASQQEQDERDETKGTLDRIDALFVRLGVENPMNPSFKSARVVNPYDKFGFDEEDLLRDPGRREVYTDPDMKERGQRVYRMTHALRDLMSQWVRQQVQEDSDESKEKKTIYQIFSTDEIDSELLEDAEEMWNMLPQSDRRALEEQTSTQNKKGSYEAKGLFRLTEALIFTLLNQSARLEVSRLEMELAVKVLDIFLFEYTMDGSLASIRGNNNLRGRGLNTHNRGDFKIRVPCRYNAGTKRYEFNCANVRIMKNDYVRIKTPNPSSGRTAEMQKVAKNKREGRFWTRLARIGGEPQIERRRRTTEAEDAEGSNLLCGNGESDTQLKALLIDRERQKEKAAEEAKRSIAKANEMSLERLEQRPLVDLTKENERKEAEEEERKKKTLGLSERNLVMRGFTRSTRPGSLPNADGSQNDPWTWSDLQAAKDKKGTNLETIYQQAVTILSTHAKEKDDEYLEKFKQRQIEIDKHKLTLTIVLADATMKKKRILRNSFKAYSWKMKTPDNREYLYPDRHTKITDEGFSSAWEYKNRDKKHFLDYRNRIAKDLWVQHYGHPLPDHKTCFPEKVTSYYANLDKRRDEVNVWMRGRVPRPLVPQKKATPAHKARTETEIEKTDQLRCQAHELMYIDFQLKDDPRMEWVHSAMLEVDKQRMQLEYETFMSEERRHILDVLRECGPDPDRPLLVTQGSKGCLERCYDADKDSYALCAPKEQDPKEQAETLGKSYSYERPCKRERDTEVDGVELLDNGADSGKKWTHPDRSKTETDAEKRVELAMKQAEKWTRAPTATNKKEMIEAASKNSALIRVNQGKPCKYGTMPTEDEDGYSSALVRWMEFEQELKVDGSYGNGEDVEDKEQRLFANFWGVYQRPTKGWTEEGAAEWAAEQREEYDRRITPGVWPQNPLTKKMTGEGLYTAPDSAGQGDKGILKTILIEWVKAAEAADENYTDTSGDWIGPTHANTFFRTRGDHFRVKANREGLNAGQDVVLTNGSKKDTIKYEPLYIAKYIHCFQSDLVRCFPNTGLNPEGEGDDLNFNDIMEFICWYTTNVWEPWPTEENTQGEMWSKLCQYGCVPAISTWKPALTEGSTYDEDRKKHYAPTALRERIMDELRTLWRGVTFCKKALDYAVHNREGILYQVWPDSVGYNKDQKEAKDNQNALRRYIRKRWCELTDGACDEDSEAPDENEEQFAKDGDDSKSEGNGKDGEGGEDGKGDKVNQVNLEAGKRITIPALRGFIQDIVRNHDDLSVDSLPTIRTELYDVLKKKYGIPMTTTGEDAHHHIGTMIEEELKVANVYIGALVDAMRAVVVKGDTEPSVADEAVLQRVKELLKQDNLKPDDREWDSRSVALKAIRKEAQELRTALKTFGTEIESASVFFLSVANGVDRELFNEAQAAQVQQMKACIDDALTQSGLARITLPPWRVSAMRDDLAGHVSSVRRMIDEVHAVRGDVPVVTPEPRRPQREMEGPKAAAEDIDRIVERIRDENPDFGKLAMIGLWNTRKEVARSQANTPWNATAAQWQSIFEAAAEPPHHLAILQAVGTRFPSGERQTEFLFLLAKWLPKMGIVALNIGEMDGVTNEAIDAIYEALKHDDCLVGHLFFDVKFTNTAMVRKMKDQLIRNRHKQGYYKQILRDEVFALKGANCWKNISNVHHARAAREVGKVSDGERANDLAAAETSVIASNREEERNARNDVILQAFDDLAEASPEAEVPLKLLTETVQKKDSKITTDEIEAMLISLEEENVLMVESGVAHRL